MRAVLLLLSLCAAVPCRAESFDGARAVIVNGDTITLGLERIRILNIDAPETFDSRCTNELLLGIRSKERLALLLRAGQVEMERQGRDRFGRTLARLSIGGRDVGETLIREGLALPWRDGAQARIDRMRLWCG
jgi:micrococcal nuclease